MKHRSGESKKSAMFEEQPEPLDEEDPEVQDELFETLRVMGTKPEDLPDVEDRKDYTAWLSSASRNGKVGGVP